MEAHQQRVVDERKDLGDKINKLRTFIQKGLSFQQLPEGEKGLLRRQLELMEEYYSVLSQRILAFPLETPKEDEKEEE